MTVSNAAEEPLRTLIVEDNRDASTTLRMLLELRYGHVVHEAADGLQGLEIALEAKPDLALIDVGLPGLTGYEVARRVRDQLSPDEIFLIALTGYGTDEDRHKTAEAGFDVHLVKPVDSADLERVLAQARTRRGVRNNNEPQRSGELL